MIFSAIDSVITQSFAGKCLLRTVIHELQKSIENIYYFPSFEIVLCDNPKSYRSDNMHVKNRRVREIFSILKNHLND